MAGRAWDLVAVGVQLPVVLTPGAAPGDLDGPLATIAATAEGVVALGACC